jgi:hypothetical protein
LEVKPNVQVEVAPVWRDPGAKVTAVSAVSAAIVVDAAAAISVVFAPLLKAKLGPVVFGT